jgi:polyribonucleotide nucleotidyltransferase
MATVCASTLALMDAGVPITKPVAGIAMGMMSDAKKASTAYSPTSKDQKIITATWTSKSQEPRDGVTGVQMDVKVEGVPLKVLHKHLSRQKSAHGDT